MMIMFQECKSVSDDVRYGVDKEILLQGKSKEASDFTSDDSETEIQKRLKR